MNSVTVPARRWLIATLMLVMGTGLLLALIHTPIVRARLLTYVARTLDDSFHIHLEADRLDFNLLTLDFELEQVSLPECGPGGLEGPLDAGDLVGPEVVSLTMSPGCRGTAEADGW